MIQDLTDELKECEATLYNITDKYIAAVRDAMQKRLVYDLAWAEAVSTISHRCLTEGVKLTVQEKDALATKECFPAMEAARIAEAELDGLKKHMDTMQAALTSIQTRAKCVQMEMSLAR